MKYLSMIQHVRMHAAGPITLFVFCGLVIVSNSTHAADAVGQTDESILGAGSHELTFERDVRPILKAMCFHCHGEEEHLQGALDLRLVRLMRIGGDSGESLIPGDHAASLLWQRIASDEMPEGAKKLNALQKETIRRWIDADAPLSRAEPDNVEDSRYTPEELSFWAFQPPKDVSVPADPVLTTTSEQTTTTNPIDAFIRHRLTAFGLKASPEASRHTLLRRLTFDLTGLPPSEIELNDFLNDQSEDAYEKVVDRLLQSPQMGIRWARHWLDVAGYAETDGVIGKDPPRPQAWRYRDYVISAFNNDKPYDQFVQEQLAGDEMIQGKPDPTNPGDVEKLTATGFMRMAPDTTSETDTLVERNQAVADSLKVVSGAVLGLTIGCAQCHDHRYDPISTEDYYRFRAIFDPAFPIHHWQKPIERVVDMTPPDVIVARAAIETEAVRKEEELKKIKTARGVVLFEELLTHAPEDLRASLKTAIELPEGERSDEQKALLTGNPMLKSVDFISTSLEVYDRELHEKLKPDYKAIADLRATAPLQTLLMAATNRPDITVESHIYFRGDPTSPKKQVQPGDIFVLARHQSGSQVSSQNLKRRLEYAKEITSPNHPMTARVAVNRIWVHLIGKGIVATPGDFGLFGARPTHPELLDWLAKSFVEKGWSTKKLIRSIVLSQTYRQDSRKSTASESIDPDNQYLSHANMQRLDAEAIRDSLLFVGGSLNQQMGGASVPVAEDENGKAVIGIAKINDGLFAGIESVGDQANRRSIYIEVKRTLPLNMLDTFDQPQMVPNCDLRKSSTVAPQSLWFLNDALIISLADDLADRLMGSVEGGSVEGGNEAYVRTLYRRLFSIEPNERELKACVAFLDKQTEVFRADPNPEWQENVAKWPHAPHLRALASFGQSLLSSNRFLYVD